MSLPAPVDHPVHPLISNRRSPYAFADRMVSVADLCALFEAARWAPSCFNEQPWHFIVATRDNPAAFEKLLSCLVEPNQVWARLAPVLGLGIARTTFARNDKPNRHAAHDLGLAVGNLTLEATARGLAIHQMGGILPDRARELYAVPEGFDILTGLALGFPGGGEALPEDYRRRDEAPRERRALDTILFEDRWESKSRIIAG